MSEFARVCVLGATRTGKSSLLSAGICANFSHLYSPTTQVETFVDAGRRLIFIDTPGIPDDRVFGDHVESATKTFHADPLVRRLLSTGVAEPGKSGEKHGERVDREPVDAYLLVYCDDEGSKLVAASLRELIFQEQRERKDEALVLLLQVIGDTGRSKRLERFPYGHSALPKLEQRRDGEIRLSPVCNETGAGIEDALDRIAEAVGTRMEEKARASRKPENSRVCSVVDCAVS